MKKLNNLVEKLTHYAKDPIKLAQLLEHPQTLMSCIQNLSFSESKDGWFRNLIRPGLFSLLFIPTKNTPENNVHADQTFESLKPIICALIAETQTPEKRHALAQIISNMVSIATTTDATANTEANTDTNNVGARIKQYLMSKEGLENLSHLIPTLLKIAPTIQDFLNNKYTSHFKNSLLLKILVALSPETQQSAFKLSDKQKKQLSAESYQALYGKKSASNNEKGLELYELVERIMDPKNDNDKTDSEEMAHLKEQRSDFEQLTAASKGLLCFLPFFFEKYNTYHYALMPALMQDKTTIVLDQAQQSKLQTLHPTAYNVYQALHSDDTETLNTLLQPLDDQSKHSVYDSLFSCLNHTQKDVLLQKSWQDTLQKFSTHIQAFEKTTVYDITTPLQGLVQLLQSVKYTQTPTIHNPANDVQQLNHLAPLLLFLLKPMLKQYGIDINNQTACAIAENLTKEVLKNVVLQHQTPKTIDGLPQKKHRFLFTRSLSSLFFKNPIAKFFDWLISAFIILPLEGLKAYFHTQRHSPKPATHRTRPHHSNTMPLPKAQTPGTGVKQTQHAHPNAPEATPQIPKAKN